jgi:hypothetical protein
MTSPGFINPLETAIEIRPSSRWTVDTRSLRDGQHRPLACRDGGFAAKQHADQGAIPSGDTVADEHVILELEWSTFWQSDPRYHRDTFEACDDARVVLCEGRGYPYGEGNSREQKAAGKSIRETHSLLRRRHASLQMPLTEASMSNVETRKIPDFRQNTVDSSCGVDRTAMPEGWSLSRRPGKHRGIGVRPPTVIPERRRAARELSRVQL